MTTQKNQTVKTANTGDQPVEKLAVSLPVNEVPAGDTPGLSDSASGSIGAENGTNGTEGEGEKETRKRGTTFARNLYSIEAALITSLNDPLIRQYVLEYGYTEERLNDGKQKASEARAKHEAQQKLLAAKAECSRVLKEKKAEAHKVYREFVRVIRLGFENQESIFRTLGISTNKKKGFGDWVAQTEIFYNNLLELPAVLEFMAKLDITREKVEAGKQLFEEVKNAKIDLKNASGEAQKATEQKIIAFREIKKWWSNYKKIVNIALEKDPQLKEKLGIVTPML
jgi:hypothetical protein